MNVFEFKLNVRYGGGLMLVSANTKEEAINFVAY